MSLMMELCLIYKQMVYGAFSTVHRRQHVSDKHMKATGPVRLQPHLDEEISFVPVGDVQKEPSDRVAGEDQSQIKAKPPFK